MTMHMTITPNTTIIPWEDVSGAFLSVLELDFLYTVKETEYRGGRTFFSDRKVPVYIQHFPTQTYIFGRGAAIHLKRICDQMGIPVKIYNQLPDPPDYNLGLEFPFNDLHEYQKELVDDITKRKTCLLKAATGAGKTVTAIAAIVKRDVKTLVIVQQSVLLDQWRTELAAWLGLDKKEIGKLGGGGKNLEKDITVGIDKTVSKMIKNNQLDQYDMVVCDEVQGMIPDGLFEFCVRNLTPTYLLGLSATPAILGTDACSMNNFGYFVEAPSRKRLTKMGRLMDYTVRRVPYDNRHYTGGDYTQLLSELAADEERLNLVVTELKNELARDTKGFVGVKLVLCERMDQIKLLGKLLEAEGIEYETIRGAITYTERERIYRAMRKSNGRIRVLLGQVRICGAGLDIPRIDCTMIATPGSKPGNLQQAVGRAIRTMGGKTVPSMVIDIQDQHGMFYNGVKSRNEFYNEDLNVFN